MGSQISAVMEAFPPRSTFSVDDIPDLTGKVMIVTGGNTGIGKETVKALLNRNAKVYMASRNRERAEEAIADLKKQTGKEAVFLDLDLASLKSIKKAAETFLSLEKQLHVLFNNGGVMRPPIDSLTADGYDLQFGTNVLGHHYFTKLLLPTLIETASGVDYETLRDEPKRRALGSSKLYAQSKFGNAVVAKETARRYADKGVVSVSVNPGNIKSDLQRYLPSIVRRLAYALILYETPFGALTQLWGATTPECENLNGKYLIPWARVGSARKESQDPGVGEELWSWLEEQVKEL